METPMCCDARTSEGCGCGCSGSAVVESMQPMAWQVARRIDALGDSELRALVRMTRASARWRHAALRLCAQAVATPGSALDAPVRRFLEARFGRDLGFLRIHRGPAADRAAAALGVPAFALGPGIVFAAEGYDPDAEAGRRLLAHEVTHVLQQAKGLSRQPSPSGDAAREAQAEAAAAVIDAPDVSPADILYHAALIAAPLAVHTINPVLARCGATCSFPFAPEGVLFDPRSGVPCGLVDCGQPFPPSPRAKSWCAYNCAGQRYGAFVINTVCGPVGPYFTDQFVN
jgi:hypothetical protein